MGHSGPCSYLDWCLKPGPGGAITVQWLAVSSTIGLAVLGRKAAAAQPASLFPAQMVTKGLCKCFMLAAAPTLLEGCQNLLEPARAQCLCLCPALSGEREYTHGTVSAQPLLGSRISPMWLLWPGTLPLSPLWGTQATVLPRSLAQLQLQFPPTWQVLGDLVSLRQWDETWGCLTAHLRSHWQKCSLN